MNEFGQKRYKLPSFKKHSTAKIPTEVRDVVDVDALPNCELAAETLIIRPGIQLVLTKKHAANSGNPTQVIHQINTSQPSQSTARSGSSINLTRGNVITIGSTFNGKQQVPFAGHKQKSRIGPPKITRLPESNSSLEAPSDIAKEISLAEKLLVLAENSAPDAEICAQPLGMTAFLQPHQLKGTAF